MRRPPRCTAPSRQLSNLSHRFSGIMTTKLFFDRRAGGGCAVQGPTLEHPDGLMNKNESGKKDNDHIPRRSEPTSATSDTSSRRA